MEHYKSLYGHVNIPSNYIIPYEPKKSNGGGYPEIVQGIRLGDIAVSIRNHGLYYDRKHELIGLGFDYDSQLLDFEVIKQSLEVYKSIYKRHMIHTMHPLFTIKSDDIRFPPGIRGKCLGKRIDRIKYLEDYRKYRTELIELGMIFNAFHPKPFGLFKQALITYKEIHGDYNIPSGYSIGKDNTRYVEEIRGLRLGKYVDCMKTGHIYNDKNEYVEELKAIDFPYLPLITPITTITTTNTPTTNTTISEIVKKNNIKPHKDYELIKQAILAYQQIHSHVTIPYDYIIPFDDIRYPEELRRYNIRLGKIVHGIIHKQYYSDSQDELRTLGLEILTPNNTSNTPNNTPNNSTNTSNIRDFELIKKALLIYKSLHGDLLIERDYIIPFNDLNYPPELRYGVRLGRIVNGIRNGIFYKEYSEELKAIGFEYMKKHADFELVKQTLLVYKEIYGDYHTIPYDYIIPMDDIRYPEAARKGMRLGKIMNGIKNHGYYTTHVDELVAMGIIINPTTSTTTTNHHVVYDDHHLHFIDYPILQDALLAYQSIYKDLNIPPTYVIPMHDKRYPEGIRGKDLGRRVTRLRNLDDYRKFRQPLLELGMTFTFQPIDFNVFKKAIVTYKELYDTVIIPNHYSIPQDDFRFAEELRGIRLGKYVACVRTGHIYSDYIHELQDLGLYDYPKLDFEVIKQCLVVYQSIYGNYEIPYDYRIPLNDTRYPTIAKNTKLGKLVNGIWCHGQFHEYTKEFQEIGFDCQNKHQGRFKIIEQALLKYKEIHGDLLVPKEYIIPSNETRYPEGLQGMRLGKIVYNIRTRENYKLFKNELLAIGFQFDVVEEVKEKEEKKK